MERAAEASPSSHWISGRRQHISGALETDGRGAFAKSTGAADETIHLRSDCALRRVGWLCRRMPNRKSQHSGDDGATGAEASAGPNPQDLQGSDQSVRLPLRRSPDGWAEPQSRRLCPVGLRRRGRGQYVTRACGAKRARSRLRARCGFRVEVLRRHGRFSGHVEIRAARGARRTSFRNGRRGEIGG